MLLLRTVHGSNLYGLNHAGSDSDWFEVYTGKFRTKHSMDHSTGLDVVKMSLDMFMIHAGGGSHQSLEAMWSHKAEVDLMPWRFNFHPNLAESHERYMRTVKRFAADPTQKKQRHAWRLKLNVSDLMNYGYFNPTLDPEQREMVEWLVDRKVHPLS